jgi:hypothetical protein
VIEAVIGRSAYAIGGGRNSGQKQVVSTANEKPQATGLTNEAACELPEVARAIEMTASPAAEKVGATFFSSAKELRTRAQSHLAGSPRLAGDYIIEDDHIVED